MSIDHSFVVCDDGSTRVVLNISGLDANSRSLHDLTAGIYAFDSRSGAPKFTSSIPASKLAELYEHLGRYSMLRTPEAPSTGKFIEISQTEQELFSLLVQSQNDSLLPALKNLVASKLTNDDVNVVLGRKDSLTQFESMMRESEEHPERVWQAFFERNEWIFGYGLKYRYLSILQREAHVSGTNLDGTNGVISDFLLSDTRFTKLVELKTPDTPIFRSARNRSDAWGLSMDLTDSVSQILTQKASWELEGSSPTYLQDGSRLREASYDVECILVIGRQSSITGNDRDRAMKRKTLELYRRNLRNIDIVTFDELLERARFIVSSSCIASVVMAEELAQHD